MAPVGPLHFVARQASAWIMTLYFGDVVRHFCRVDRFRVPDVVRIRYPTLVTLLRLPYKSYKRCRSKKNYNNPGVRAQLLCVVCTQRRSQGERRTNRAIGPPLRTAGPSGQRPTKRCSIARATELYSSRIYLFCKP